MSNIDTCQSGKIAPTRLTSILRLVHVCELSKVDVEHWHMPVWPFHCTFYFLNIFFSKLIESVRMMACVVWLAPLEAAQGMCDCFLARGSCKLKDLSWKAEDKCDCLTLSETASVGHAAPTRSKMCPERGRKSVIVWLYRKVQLLDMWLLEAQRLAIKEGGEVWLFDFIRKCNCGTYSS